MTIHLRLLAATLAALMAVALCALATTAGAQAPQKTPPQIGMLFLGGEFPYTLQRGKIYDVVYKASATHWKVRIARIYLDFPAALQLLMDGSTQPLKNKGQRYWVLHNINPRGPARTFHVRMLVRHDAQPGQIMLKFRYTAIAKSRTEERSSTIPRLIAHDL
jgi:hypothetical protein